MPLYSNHFGNDGDTSQARGSLILALKGPCPVHAYSSTFSFQFRSISEIS